MKKTPTPDFLPADSAERAMLESTRVVGDILTQAHELQMQTLLSWQKSLVDLNQELWDEWACRWAGGVPIDG